MSLGQKFREYTMKKMLGALDKRLKPDPIECRHAGCSERFTSFVALFKHQVDSHQERHG